jgi:putative MATE family efflux protein
MGYHPMLRSRWGIFSHGFYNVPVKERQRAHEERVTLLTTGSLTRSIFSLALPIIAANTLSIAMELTNAFFLGRLGANALAAITMSQAVVFFVNTFGSGLSIGTVALVSRAYGSRNYAKAEHIGTQSLYLGLAVSVVLGTAGFLLSPSLLSLMGAKGEILAMADIYLRFLFAGMFLIYFFFQGMAVFQGAGDTMTPMKIGALSMVLNIALDPVLIFGLLGAPRMGVAGAAISTIIARGVGSVLMGRIIIRGRHAVRLSRVTLKPDFAVMRNIFLVGFPGSIQLLIRSSSVMVLTRLAALFEPTVLAALGVGNRLFGIFLLPGFGFGAASSTLVGQNLGARNPNRAEKAALLTAGYYLVLIVVCAVPVFVFCRQLSALFNPGEHFVQLTSQFIRYICVGALFLSPGMVFSQALQGAGATVYPMVVAGVTLYGVQIPLTYLLAVHFRLEAQGIWISNLTAGLVNAILMSAIFFRGGWKAKKV